jgi:hypothetical protein
MERNHMDLLPPHLHCSVTLPLQSSNSVHMNADSNNHVITSPSDRFFGLVDIQERGLKRNKTEGTE